MNRNVKLNLSFNVYNDVFFCLNPSIKDHIRYPL